MPRRRAREADRRAGLLPLLARMVETLPRRQPGVLRDCLERTLALLVPARHVALREMPAGGSQPSSPETVVLEVPNSAALLEARVEPAGGLDRWDVQMLRTAGYLAALVLEIEHARENMLPERAVQPPARGGPPTLVGSSPAMHLLRDRIARVASTDFTVLIEGESGSGKELVARQIHQRSRRSRGPFVAVNCAALVETLLEAELFGIEERTATGVRGRRGKFEHADGGTLFLDEVSDLSPSAQAKLLRAIQDLAVERVGGHGTRRVDARIVVATNRSLARLVEKGRFRPDLYYRLCGIEVLVPPLRERREDIIELVEHFLERHRRVRKLGVSPAAADALLFYDWPGNVRELERVIERAVALAASDRIEVDDLPPVVGGDYGDVLLPSAQKQETLRAWARRYVRLVFERCGGNKRRTCRMLGISYHTLQAHLDDRPSAAGPARPRVLPARVSSS